MFVVKMVDLDLRLLFLIVIFLVFQTLTCFGLKLTLLKQFVYDGCLGA